MSTEEEAQTSPKPKVKLEIISDVICPYCYVAKLELYQAIKEVSPEVDVDVTWQPFFLDPDLVKGREIPKMLAYEQKFGKEESERMVERLEKAFADVGVKYTRDGVTSNTLDAHRLLEWAQETGTKEQRDALVEALFQAYFAKGLNVGDHEVLVKCAEECGLDPVKAKEILSGDEYERKIDTKMWMHKTKGIQAVPTFVFQGKFKFSGARKAEFFKGLIEQIVEM